MLYKAINYLPCGAWTAPACAAPAANPKGAKSLAV